MLKPDPNDSVLTIRFVGEQLKTQGLPIYELGLTFIALQRLVHKAYLASLERLDKGAYPHKSERKTLALQIQAHEKRSDFYAFAPILADPATIHIINNVVDFVLKGVASYSFKRVLETIRGEKDEKKQIYIGSIHAEVVNIVNRIENVGGCDSIEIGSPKFAPNETLKFGPSSKDYARKIANESFLGSVQTISGNVFKMYPNISMVEIRRPGGRKCKIFLAEKDFDHIRYGQIKSPFLRTIGRPRYKIGTDGNGFDEFEATKIELSQDED